MERLCSVIEYNTEPATAVDSAFRSVRTNEVYMFIKNRYVLIDYAPGTTNDEIITGPLYISSGFPSLTGTAFADYGIDAAFSCDGIYEAFIFSSNLCARIKYGPGTTDNKIMEGPRTIKQMFPFLKDTLFEKGLDAAFESTRTGEAYLFKGPYYALINFSRRYLIAIRLITKGFLIFQNTIFDSDIGAAFRAHNRPHNVYLFKNNKYVLISFTPGKTNDCIIGGPKDIVPYNWPSLKDIIMRDNYIDSAFRSVKNNEAYLFTKNKYVRINYAPGTTNDWIINGPLFISKGFPSLMGTAFAKHGIDAAFSCDGIDEAFIFSTNLCARIKYAPGTTDDKIMEGPRTIKQMFPFLKGTQFEKGVDAAFESTRTSEAYLFKGPYYALVNFSRRYLIATRLITDGFLCFRNTIFDSDIGAAFRAHDRANNVYLFKNDKYVLLYFTPGKTGDFIISGPKDIVPFNWPSLKDILPSKNRALDYIE